MASASSPHARPRPSVGYLAKAMPGLSNSGQGGEKEELSWETTSPKSYEETSAWTLHQGTCWLLPESWPKR
jgi:hypothetical protein